MFTAGLNSTKYLKKLGNWRVYLRLFLGSLLFEVSWVLSAGHCISSDFYKERNIS
jgi:hypothetical protein